MDRRFVALKATDDQEAAVAVFRQYDRSALPGHRHRRHAHRHRHHRRRAGRGGGGGDRDIQRIGGSEALDEPYMEIGFGRMIQKRAGWLTALFLGEMLTATAMGVLRAGDREGGGARAVRAAHHLERRQLRIAGVDAGHPRAGAGRGRPARLVAGDAARARWPGWRSACILGSDRLPAHRALVGVLGHLRPALAAGRRRPSPSRWSASCCGARWPARCCRSCCAGSASIRQRRRRRSSRRWSTSPGWSSTSPWRWSSCAGRCCRVLGVLKVQQGFHGFLVLGFRPLAPEP